MRAKTKMSETPEKKEYILGNFHRDWVGYRPEIKLLDCTIRDGGLMNDHLFSDEVVRSVYQACSDAGIDYMELGYKANKKIYSPDQFGKWKFCDEDHIRNIVGDNNTSLKLSVMADAERTDYHNDILPKEDSVIDFIRVATYINQIPTAIDIIKDAKDKGYECSCNLMAISTVQESLLKSALEALIETPVDSIFIVDSFGSLYGEQIRELATLYLSYAKPAGKEIGIHTHNNQQLAYANTVEALVLGANRLDGSMAGLGRGAGNCPIELLVGFLHNPKLKLRPILKCIRDNIEPMREKLKWGFSIPYMITGQHNQHPRSAMKFMEETDAKDIVQFFDSILEEE